MGYVRCLLAHQGQKRRKRNNVPLVCVKSPEMIAMNPEIRPLTPARCRRAAAAYLATIRAPAPSDAPTAPSEPRVRLVAVLEGPRGEVAKALKPTEGVTMVLQRAPW